MDLALGTCALWDEPERPEAKKKRQRFNRPRDWCVRDRGKLSDSARGPSRHCTDPTAEDGHSARPRDIT